MYWASRWSSRWSARSLFCDHRERHAKRYTHHEVAAARVGRLVGICVCTPLQWLGLVREIHLTALYTSRMSEPGLSFDEFQALEQKVLRAVEIVKQERLARVAAEAEVEQLRAQLAAQEAAKQSEVAALNEDLSVRSKDLDVLNKDLNALTKEREVIRTRVEGMLKQIDELL